MSYTVGSGVEEYVASKTLTAAFVAEAILSGLHAIQRVGLFVQYTQGAAGGFPRFRWEWSQNDSFSTAWVDTVLTGSVLSFDDVDGPSGTGNYYFALENPSKAPYGRLLMREQGAPGTPGDIIVDVEVLP